MQHVFYDPNDMQSVAGAAIATEVYGQLATYHACDGGRYSGKPMDGASLYIGVIPESPNGKAAKVYHQHPGVAKDLSEHVGSVLAKPIYLNELWFDLKPGTKPNRRWKRLVEFLQQGPMLGREETTQLERGYLVVADTENRTIEHFLKSSDSQKDHMAVRIAPKKKAYILERLATAAVEKIGNHIKALVIHAEEHCVCELTAYLGFMGRDANARKDATCYGVGVLDASGAEIIDLHAFPDQRIPGTDSVREQHMFISREETERALRKSDSKKTIKEPQVSQKTPQLQEIPQEAPLEAPQEALAAE
jgi:hypothetical protein